MGFYSEQIQRQTRCTNSIITNVADGTISSTSSDAVNGSQLYDTSKYIADALGGDAEVNADGTMTAPTYSIANEDYHSVGEAWMRSMITRCCGMKTQVPTTPA